MMSSDWLSTTGGWCRFVGDRHAGSLIANACIPMQSLMTTDHEPFVAAIKRHRRRGDDTEIGGIRVITLLNGQRVIRMSDITVPEVRARINAAMDRDGLAFGRTMDDEPRVSQAPVGFLDAELWWRWCRSASR